MDPSLFGIAVLLVLFLLYKRFFAIKSMGLPGPPKKAFLGNLGLLTQAVKDKNLHLVVTELCRKYGPVMEYSVPGQLYVGLSDPDMVRQVLETSGTAIDAKFIASFSKFTNGLLVLQGDTWAHHRQFAQKAFTNDTLRAVVNVTNNAMTPILEKIKAAAVTKKSVDVYPLFEELSTTVLSRVVLGSNPVHDVTERTVRILNGCSERAYITELLWWLLFDQKTFYNDINHIRSSLAKLIDERKQIIERDGASNLLLDNLIIQSRTEQFSDKEILDEVVMFYTAGFETTASLLTFTCHVLSQNPEVVDMVSMEAKRVKGNKKDFDFDDINQLEYTEMVIKESLRLWSPAPLTSRTLTQDTKIGSYSFAANTTFHIPFWAIHHDADIWGDPELFRPERFAQTPRVGTFLPFSLGRRPCIGNRFAMYEVKTAIAHLCENFKLCPDPTKPIVPVFSMTLSCDAKAGAYFHFTSRE